MQKKLLLSKLAYNATNVNYATIFANCAICIIMLIRDNQIPKSNSYSS